MTKAEYQLKLIQNIILINIWITLGGGWSAFILLTLHVTELLLSIYLLLKET